MLLALMTATIALPPAYANPGHELNINPLFGPAGTSFELFSVVDESTPKIHVTRYVVVMDPDEDFAVVNNPNACDSLVAEPGDRLWELQDQDGDQVGAVYQAHVADQSSTIRIDDDFGSGDFTSSMEDTTVPAILFHDETGGALNGGAAVPPSYQFQWRDGDGNPDDTSTASLYHFVACGFVDLNGNDVFNSGIDLPDVIAETFRVTQLVGGETLPVDAAALFAAGAFANAQAIIPVLGGIVGIAVFLIKLGRK
jgi:hypothetical protein